MVAGGTIESAHLFFASFDSPAFTAPTPFFALEKGPARGLVNGDAAVPALLGPDIAALVADESAWEEVVFDRPEEVPISYAHPAQAV